MMYSVKVLRDGYSYEQNGLYKANGTCTLIFGQKHIDTGSPQIKVIVDTLSAWDRDLLTSALAAEGVRPEDITHVVNTHGHPDHVGNNNLFTGPGVVHVMGHSIQSGDVYNTDVDFKAGDEYCIDGEILKVFSTPGHTLDSVSVKVVTEQGVCVVAGDTFEKKEDMEDDSVWKEAGSDNEKMQKESREAILQMADFIIPGHGPIFKNPRRSK